MLGPAQRGGCIRERAGSRPPRDGTISLQLLVLLVPVMFGMMGFAFDLGRMYLIRGELNQAATAMATAAANKLIGTSQSLDDATTEANLMLDDSTGHGAKYNFGSILLGQSTGLLASSVSEPAFYGDSASATGTGLGTGTPADGTTARFAQITITADAPLLFWSFLSLGQSRSTPIAAQAVAGISAPLCTACGIENFAVPAISTDDTTDFGFTSGSRYTFAYQCTNDGGQQPTGLNGTLVRYVLLNRYDDTSTLDEQQQLYRIGAQGLLPSNDITKGCIKFTTDTTETVWATAAPQGCSAALPASVQSMLCGLYSRFDNTPPSACSSITDIDALAAVYQADADITDLDDYTAYTGSVRRVITVPIVDSLSDTSAMTVLGFRQFLVEPNPDDVVTNPADRYGRFAVLYIGSPVPLKQGRFDGGCGITSGPGKVVVYQ